MMIRYAPLGLLVVLAGATAAHAQGPCDGVRVDPTHHHVILENDHVRVYEVLGAPGATSTLHTHEPLVVVSLGKARLLMAGPDGTPFVFDLNPSHGRSGPPTTARPS